MCQHGTIHELCKLSSLGLESRDRDTSLPIIVLCLMAGLQRWQPMWMPSQILIQRVGPNCLATQDISPIQQRRDNDDAEEARKDSQSAEVINEYQTRVATAMDGATTIEQLPIPPLAETHMHLPMTHAVQLPPWSPTPTMSRKREQPIRSPNLSSLLQCQTSETRLHSAVHPSARKLKNKHNAKSQLP